MRLARAPAGAIDQTGGEALRIVEQDLENVFGKELLMPFAQRQRLGRLDESAGAVGIFVDVHVPRLRRPGSGARIGTPETSSLGAPEM